MNNSTNPSLKDKSTDTIFYNRIEWLNSKEAAEYLRISVNNLRNKTSKGLVPINGRLGNKLMFRRDKLDELLETSIKNGEDQ